MIGGAAAVSLALLAQLEQEQDTNHSWTTPVGSRMTSRSAVAASTTSCEAMVAAAAAAGPHHLHPTGRRTRLARRATIRKMDENSSRATLRSKYRVDWDEPLGEGAFGAVYLASDRQTGEQVAVKKITKEFTDDVSFQHEMNALLHLRKAGGHPNICSLREHFNEGGHYFVILDLVQGGELFDHLVANGAYSESEAARLIREVASALAFIHGMDTVHGDLKVG